MKSASQDEIFNLCDAEVETLRRAAAERDMLFDSSRRQYSLAELSEYGLVRESYDSDELKAFGVDRNKVVTSFDPISLAAREHLVVDAPFADKIRKWQIPIDITDMRTLISEFPPESFVEPHVHPKNTNVDPGGSLRVILSGSIEYAGKIFVSGDWFYIPNGVPYSFRTNEKNYTVVLYSYAFFAPSDGNRFSYPTEIESYRKSAEKAA
jgi:hypothetical protein